MKALDRVLDKIMRGFMAASMLALVIGGFWQVFSRLILRNPSTFTEEFMRYMLIWASMIGSAYCFYKNQHLTLDLVKNKFSGPAKTVVLVFIELSILLFVVYVFIYGGFRMAVKATNISPVLHIPYKVLYQILPVSGGFIVLARILTYIKMLSERKEAKKGDAP